MNGQDALQIVSAEQPDLILLDVQMPGMSGLEVLEILKSKTEYKHIPVIMLSANSRPETFGVDDWICKPFRKNELLQKIRRHIVAHFLLSSDECKCAMRYRSNRSSVC